MRQLQYGSDAAPLRLRLPVEWDGASLSALSFSAYDLDGEELLAADSATLYTATSLDGSVAQYASTITLDSGAGALSPGDEILIVGAAGNERRTVKAYDSANKIATLDQILDYAHDDNEVVYGLFATYDLDISDTDTWYAGLVARFIWTPTGTGHAITHEYQVAATALDISGLEQMLRDRHPRAYSALTSPTDRLERVVEQAKDEVRDDLIDLNIQMDRLVDQSRIARTVLAQVVRIWMMDGDKDMMDEREAAEKEYAAQLGKLAKSANAWQDQNQDGVEDEGEATSHEPYFRKGW